MSATYKERIHLKFIVGNGQQLKKELETFPDKYRSGFSSSQILVLCVASDNEVVGACSISKMSNYALAFIKKHYRGRGLGTKLEARTYKEARRRGLSFVAGAIHVWNLPALRVALKVGYREVVRFEDFGYILLMIPFDYRGELLYTLLHGVCTRIPRTLLHSLILTSMSVVAAIRGRLGSG